MGDVTMLAVCLVAIAAAVILIALWLGQSRHWIGQ